MMHLQRSALFTKGTLPVLSRPVPLHVVRRPIPAPHVIWSGVRVNQKQPSGETGPNTVGPLLPSTHDVLENVRRALGVTPVPHNHQETVVSGIGRHLGISIKWCVRWRPDGAFQEEISGKELGFQWGYDGRPDSCCWEMDSSGVARQLECDDHEALLVGAWVRTGLWLHPELSKRLDIQLEQQDVVNTRPTRRRAAATADATTTTTITSDSNSKGRRRLGKTPQQALKSVPERDDDPLVLTVRIVGGKLVNRVRVCRRTWSVQGLDQPLCGDTEIWQFGSWKAWQPNVMYPEHMSHQAIAGGHHVYLAQSCSTRPMGPIKSFQCPATPVLPLDTTFTSGIPPELPVWRAGSGHLLVRPKINGKEGGYMVLDTGASGFVITPNAAMSLGLDAFGELFAASIAGKIPAQFVKARSWSLGPLHITSPVMMTMPLDGLVRAGPTGGDVIGIVGYDIFRRAVIELPSMSPTSHATASPASNSPSSHNLAPIPSTATTTTLEQLPGELSTPDGGNSSSSSSSSSTSSSVDESSFSDSQLNQLQDESGVLLGGAPATCRPLSAHIGMSGVQPVLAGSASASGVVAAAAAGGPLPFLRGLFSGWGGGGWGGGGRTRVHSSSTGEACASSGTNPGVGSSLPSISQEGDSSRGMECPAVASTDENGGGLLKRSGSSTLVPVGGCQQYTMRLYNPDEYGPLQEFGWTWQGFQMIASLPHLKVHFQGADGTPLTVMLMVDSGACGADIMLHARAMRELDLQKLSRPTSHFVRGVGGSGGENSVKVEMLDLNWVELGGVRFSEVKCMYAGVGGLDISLYSAGILCGDLLTRLPTCYDYARKRIGFKLTPVTA